VLYSARDAMQRFCAPVASSSSGHVAQLATTAATSISDSAERPAAATQLSITTIYGVQRWLAENHVAICNSAEAQRITEMAISETKT